MADRPLSKPLRRIVSSSRRRWLRQRPFALAAFALGLISFIVVAVTQQGQVWSTPDWRISVPGFAITAIAAIISLARREHGPGFWALGVGMAGAALVLGWFMMLAVVIGVTLLLMVILSTVM